MPLPPHIIEHHKNYKYQPFPACLYGPDGQTRVVQNQTEKDLWIGRGWSELPDAPGSAPFIEAKPVNNGCPGPISSHDDGETWTCDSCKLKCAEATEDERLWHKLTPVTPLSDHEPDSVSATETATYVAKVPCPACQAKGHTAGGKAALCSKCGGMGEIPAEEAKFSQEPVSDKPVGAMDMTAERRAEADQRRADVQDNPIIPETPVSPDPPVPEPAPVQAKAAEVPAQPEPESPKEDAKSKAPKKFQKAKK